MKGKIVVLAGSMEQFRYWLKHNVIPITKNDDVQRMIGAKIDAIYKEGTWYPAGLWGFDQYVKISSYDEIAADFYGMGDGVTSEEQPTPVEDQPTTRTRSRVVKEPEPLKERHSLREVARGRSTQTQDDLPFKKEDSGGSSPCPFGHNWGHDVNNTLDCKNCKDEDFNGCIDENDKIKEQGPSVPSTAPEATPSRRRTTIAEPAPVSSRRRRT